MCVWRKETLQPKKKKIKYTYISSSFWSASFQAFPRVVLFHSQTFWPCFCHMGLSISTNTWEGSRSSQVQILMSLNHLTHGYFWSFSCLVNCTVLEVFHSLKDPLWKYLMSINGPNEPIGQPSRDPSTTLWPEVTSVQPGAAFPFLSFCGAVLSCCPSWVAPGSIPGCAVDHQWIPGLHIQHCWSLPLGEALGWWDVIFCFISALSGCRSVTIFIPCTWNNFTAMLYILISNPYCFMFVLVYYKLSVLQYFAIIYCLLCWHKNFHPVMMDKK